MELARLDFQQLRVKHIFFRTKVRALLYGSTFDDTFFSDENPISLWFKTIGKVKYSQEQDVMELARMHQHLNADAVSLNRLYNNGMIEQAHEALKHIDSQSERFLELLSKIEQRFWMN